MRKLKELSLTELLYARILTFLQETLIRLSVLANGKLEKTFLRMYDRVSRAHFRLFFQMDIKEVLNKIQSGVLDSETNRSLVFNVVKPFAKRQVQIQTKAYRLYKGEKTSAAYQDFLVGALTVSMFTGRPFNEVSDEMMELLKEKVDAARKAP